MARSTSNSTTAHGRSCPCKKLPYALSSWTAAEHGDVHSLLKKGNDHVADKFDAAGNSPLHFAAQHGHVAATAALLSAGCTVNGLWDKQQAAVYSRADENNDRGGAPTINEPKTPPQALRASTPLHRASYSGAVGTMQLLIAQSSCHLLLKDTSFGDGRTALHKAVAGGRPLAVQLLLSTLEDRNLLKEAWDIRDSQQQSAIQLARSMQNESPSTVARWNATAGGGSADWKACLQLLEAAERRLLLNQQSSNQTNTALPNSPQSTIPQTPIHLQSLASCLDCENSESGSSCMASSWERAFWSALSNSARDAMREQKCAPIPAGQTNRISFLDRQSGRDDSNYEVSSTPMITTSTEDTNEQSAPQEPPHQQEMGAQCDACGKHTIALYQAGQQRLCRKCRKRCK